MNEAQGKATIHAVLVNVNSTGILITGESGIGKSECALRLISRGHSLVADDVVELEVGSSGLAGSAPTKLRRLIEIRNIGIVDIVGLFGRDSFRAETSVEAVVEIVNSVSDDHALLRDGTETTEILGTSLPLFRLVAGQTRDLPLLIEIAVKTLKEPQIVRPLDSIKRFV